MIKTQRKTVHKSVHTGAVLTDVSKVFGCIVLGLHIAKLDAYDISKSFLDFIHSYLVAKKTEQQLFLLTFLRKLITSVIPQVSILGMLLLNMFKNGLF